MAGQYDSLTREQLAQLLEKRDRQKKLGLVWERDEIEADKAVDANFVACSIVPDLCEGEAPWPNLVIEGDNYDALRWLRMAYAGRIKCIYIDPPYNTGNKDWIYNDRFFDTNDRYRHSTWLEFLYRRLTIARDLLTDDGVILVSINDENRSRLDLLLEEIMPGMRIGAFVWKTRAGTRGEGAYLSQDNEYVLAYGKPSFRFGGTAPDASKYSNADNDPRGDWVSVAFQTNKTFRERPNSYFPVLNPNTNHWHPCNPERVWAFQMQAQGTSRGATYEDLLRDGKVLFSREGETQRFETMDDLVQAIRERRAHPYLREGLPNLEFWVGKEIALGSVRKKQFFKELKSTTKPVSSWIDRINGDGDEEDVTTLHSGMSQEGTAEIRNLFGETVFPTAKPLSLIRELLKQSTGPTDCVLDFFAGSATTAQAVMELNVEDEGDRRFIMVSSTEATDDEPGKNLCRDVCAQRIKLINASTAPKYVDLSARFAYLRVEEVEFEDLDYDLQPSSVWSILEAMHDLPLTPYELEKPWNVHEADALVLIYVDRFDPALVEYLQTLSKERRNAFVYTWAPGLISPHTAGLDIELHPVRETLMKRFQQ